MPQNDIFIFLNSILAGTFVVGFFYFINYITIFPKLFIKNFFESKLVEINIFKFNSFRFSGGFFISLNNFFYY